MGSQLSEPKLSVSTGSDLGGGGLLGSNEPPLFARFIRLTVPFLLPPDCSVLVTQSANLTYI